MNQFQQPQYPQFQQSQFQQYPYSMPRDESSSAGKIIAIISAIAIVGLIIFIVIYSLMKSPQGNSNQALMNPKPYNQPSSYPQSPSVPTMTPTSTPTQATVSPVAVQTTEAAHSPETDVVIMSPKGISGKYVANPNQTPVWSLYDVYITEKSATEITLSMVNKMTSKEFNKFDGIFPGLVVAGNSGITMLGVCPGNICLRLEFDPVKKQINLLNGNGFGSGLPFAMNFTRVESN